VLQEQKPDFAVPQYVCCVFNTWVLVNLITCCNNVSFSITQIWRIFLSESVNISIKMNGFFDFFMIIYVCTTNVLKSWTFLYDHSEDWTAEPFFESTKSSTSCRTLNLHTVQYLPDWSVLHGFGALAQFQPQLKFTLLQRFGARIPPQLKILKLSVHSVRSPIFSPSWNSLSCSE
jgi:hypothetical protein